jgi:hypothetical protein
MCEQTEIAELHEIYQGMDAKGREKMTTAAIQLLKVQKSFKENPDNAQLPEHKKNEQR